MVGVMALWLPILIASVLVFLASGFMHMVLTYHRKDYGQIPGETNIAAAMRQEHVPPGTYVIPYCSSPKAMGTPEMIEKYKQGPVAMLTVWPSRPPAMNKQLGQWFVFCVVISIFAAYLTGRTMAPGSEYMSVFRVSSTVAFLGYAGCEAVNAIWKGEPWGVTIKNIIDGFIYALLTAGAISGFWPDA